MKANVAGPQSIVLELFFQSMVQFLFASLEITTDFKLKKACLPS